MARPSASTSLLVLLLLIAGRDALLTPNKLRPAGTGTYHPLIPLEPATVIQEPAAQALLQAIDSVSIKVPEFISPQSRSVETAYAFFPQASNTKNSQGQSKSKKAPVVLLHGFDSSSCEYRRLAPLLAAQGDRDVYIPDLYGWGFTAPPADAADFGPQAKMEHLKCFIRQVCMSSEEGYDGQPVVVIGASLGGALAITLAADSPEMVEKVVLIDAQGFIDGKGKADIPIPLARFGVNILKSSPLRMFANILAYKDKKFATFDAMRVGKLHCYVPSWEQASIAFLLSGGFVVSNKVPLVTQETLLLWGRNDEIIEPSTAQRFVDVMPKCKLEWVEECGHVPHLEQPLLTSRLILDFLLRAA